MKLRSSIIVFLLLCCYLVSKSETNETGSVRERFEREHIAVASKSQNGVVMMFLPSKDRKPDVSAPIFSAGKPIRFGFCSTGSAPAVLFILLPEFGFRISAFAENGDKVELSHQGARFGKRFADLEGYDKRAIDTSRSKPPHWYIAAPSDTMPTLESTIPSPDDLFNFSHSGRYTMIVEASCFLGKRFPPPAGSHATNYVLVKFPPVKLQIIKEDPQK